MFYFWAKNFEILRLVFVGKNRPAKKTLLLIIKHTYSCSSFLLYNSTEVFLSK